MLEFKVTGLGIDTRTDSPLVILHSQGEPNLILPIWIGRLEAQSIAIALQGEKLDRPLTHDLMLNTIEELNCTIHKVVIHTVLDGTFYAHLILDNSGQEIVLDARPSDCIALALRNNSLIYVSSSVQEQSCIPAIVTLEDEEEFIIAEKEVQEKEEFRKFLDNVKASDFKLPPQGN